MTKETRRRRPEHELLDASIPDYLRLNPPANPTQSSAADMSSSNLPPKAETSGLSRSLSRDSYNNKDDAQHDTPETAPAPSASGFISSIRELGRNPESILDKTLNDLSEREREPLILISEVIRQTVSSQDSERFSVACQNMVFFELWFRPI